ncbi:MAG: hypothetical protein LBK66_07960 [Spirochaetaceae bacterium]|jgi:hypothetical protein|nr:hypothetical protein [Spirochaetaceae bacterium]
MKEVSSIPNTQENAPAAITIFSPETPISKLRFSQRSFKALTKNGYDTVALLLALSEEKLVAIKNLGKKSIKEIRTVREQLQQQAKTAVDGRLESMSAMDCRFIQTRETIYPTDYIGVLDISLKAHKVLYNAGIFSAGKLFNLEKEAVYKLAKTTKEIHEELLAFIAQEKSLAGKIFGDEDMIAYIQKMSEECHGYRMSALEEAYNKIPENRLDKPLILFLQGYGTETIQYPAARLSPLLKKIKKVSGIKNIFPTVVKTSRTGDVVRIIEAISFNLTEALNKTFTPVFTDPRNANSLNVLYQRANGFTLQDIAEKRNLTRERIRQIEMKVANELIDIIKDFPVNILSFICIETESGGYISAGSVREYLADFRYNSQLVYLLENENIYKEYQYNRRYDVLHRSGLDLDFSALDIKKSVKELTLNDREVETGKKIEDFLIGKNLAKCTYDDICKFTSSEVGYVRAGKII